MRADLAVGKVGQYVFLVLLEARFLSGKGGLTEHEAVQQSPPPKQQEGDRIGAHTGIGTVLNLVGLEGHHVFVAVGAGEPHVAGFGVVVHWICEVAF